MDHILIVDDEPIVANLLKDILEPKSYHCTIVSNAEEARQILMEQNFELVLCDVNMPRESGLEFSRFVLSEYLDTAIVMVTGLDDPLIASEALEDGVYDYITKPLRRNRVLNSVANALHRRQLEVANRDHQKHLESQVLLRTKNLQNTIKELEKTQSALKESEEKFRQIGACAQEAIILMEPEGKVLYWNAAAEKMFGYPVPEAMNKHLPSLIAPQRYYERFEKKIAQFLETVQGVAAGQMLELTAKRNDGNEFPIELSLSAMKLKGKWHVLGIIRDISERRVLEAQLVQAQKLESIGQLAAGIAHEINTPIQYVSYNTNFLKEQFEHLDPLFNKYQSLFEAAKAGEVPDELISEIDDLHESIDLSFIREEIPPAIKQSLEGVDRVSEIVRAMKDFSHPGNEEKTPMDINKAIESTITVTHNEWKYVAELETHLDKDLPLVPCLPGDFNQVILNIIINAAHAIGDVIDENTAQKGTITVSTGRNNGWAEVRIQDTGSGIPEAHRSRIFDPFFTTKEVGRGTGQGLAISRSVVVEKHGGSLSFETTEGKGTTFIIRLPLG